MPHFSPVQQFLQDLYFGQRRERSESQHSQLGVLQTPGHGLLCKNTGEKSLLHRGKNAIGVQEVQTLSDHNACSGQPVPSYETWGNCRGNRVPCRDPPHTQEGSRRKGSAFWRCGSEDLAGHLTFSGPPQITDGFL